MATSEKAKMSQAQILKSIKEKVSGNITFQELISVFEGIQIGDDAWALEIPQESGESRYVVLELTGKKAQYNPFEEVDEWEFKKKERADRKAIADANKAKRTPKGKNKETTDLDAE